MLLGAKYLKVKLPSSGASPSDANEYVTVYIPVSVNGFTPTVALISVMVIVPSSTRTPFGSVTVIELASGASESNVTCPVTVTFVGDTDNVEPLIGLVLTKVFADAALTPKNARSRTAATRKRITTTFHKLGDCVIRLYSTMGI